jgi:hypothetical protein
VREDDRRQVTTVVPAEGVILERVREAMHLISPQGLSRRAYSRFDTVQMKTAWGRHHQRRLALMDGADVLASATRYDLAAVLDQQPVRVRDYEKTIACRPRPSDRRVSCISSSLKKASPLLRIVVSIVGRTWTIEECGDRHPSGARVGAILQALIAREPVERRPTIRAWLPSRLRPPAGHDCAGEALDRGADGAVTRIDRGAAAAVWRGRALLA